MTLQIDFARAVAQGRVAEFYPASLPEGDAITVDIAVHEALVNLTDKHIKHIVDTRLGSLELLQRLHRHCLVRHERC